MCLPKPGPRCSSHAHRGVVSSLNKLNKSKQKLFQELKKTIREQGYDDVSPALEKEIMSREMKTDNSNSKKLLEDVVTKGINHERAITEYLSTPAGIENLKRQYGENHLVAEIYQNRRDLKLEEFKKARPDWKGSLKDISPEGYQDIDSPVRKYIEKHNAKDLEKNPI